MSDPVLAASVFVTDPGTRMPLHLPAGSTPDPSLWGLVPNPKAWVGGVAPATHGWQGKADEADREDDVEDLPSMTVAALRVLATQRGLTGLGSANKATLIAALSPKDDGQGNAEGH